MKIMKNALTAVVSVAAVIAMTACSSDSDSPIVSGKLATGGFTKEVAKDGSNVWNNLPFNGSTSIREQRLVHAADIKGSGYIESFAFKSAEAEVETNCPDITVKMGHTSVSALSTTFANNVEEGKGTHQTVLNGSLTISAMNAGDFFTIDLDEPFYYNGVDNLVMDFIVNQGCSNGISIMGDTTIYATAEEVYALDANDTAGAWSTHTSNVVLNFAGGVNAQENGGDITHAYPFNGSTMHIQNLYTSSDINGSGPITGFGLQMNGVSLEADYTVNVKMGHYALSDLQEIYADNSNDLQAVATDVNVTIPAGLVAGDWVWIPLTGNFNYNGTDNLLVDFETTAGTGVMNAVRATLMTDLVRAAGVDGTDTAQFVDTALNNAKFRFNGATTDVIGIGSTFDTIPFNDNVTGSMFNYLYPATELGTSGKVTSVYVRLKNDSVDGSYPNFKVVLGHTNLNEVTAAFADNMDDATEVYSGTYAIPAGLKAGDWIEVPLDTPFNYNATQNLVVQMESDAGSIDQHIVCSLTIPNRHAYAWDRTALTADGVNAYFVDLRLNIEQ